MSYTVTDAENAIADHEFVDTYTYGGETRTRRSSGWDEWSELYEAKADAVEVDGIGMVKAIDGEDAGEGDYAAGVFVVFEVTDSEGGVRHFRKNGYYQSYNGTEWDGDFFEAKQVEKVITVWGRA
ncbi:hypothetical protein ACH47B_13175 [Rhodococcus sp. NPDC019627]|uniref:hypothetical protein n=1 Tax=unclassified Rhodococcus (in: high G+C Gram-positive bacteria) TaxID=192944 RepID=UPI0033E11E8A